MKSRPRNITFHMTDQCVFHCHHCWTTGAVRAKGLPGSYYLSTARSLQKYYDGVTILLTGGEVLTRPDIFSLIQAMREDEIQINLNSNGFLIDPDVARRLADSGLEYINLSLDGTPEVNNRIRKHPQAFDHVMSAIRNLKSAKPEMDITLVCTLQAWNLDDIPGYLKWILSDERIAGVQLQVITNPKNIDPDQAFLSDATLWPNNTQKALETVDRIIELKSSGHNVKNPINQLLLFKEYFKNPLDFIHVTCLADEVGLLVDSYGDVMFCNYIGSVGSILEDDIAEILDSPRTTQIRNRMRACKKTNCHFVMNCFYNEACKLAGS